MSWRSGIHGYAAIWNVITAPLSRPHAPHLARPARFNRGCFVYDPARVDIWFMHRSTQVVGRGLDLGLKLWDDTHGLAFAFTPPPTAYSLVSGIADGRYAACSVGFSMTGGIEAAGPGYIFDDISEGVLQEISIAPAGACPGAICWHAASHPAQISDRAAHALKKWTDGRATLGLPPMPPRAID